MGWDWVGLRLGWAGCEFAEFDFAIFPCTQPSRERFQPLEFCPSRAGMCKATAGLEPPPRAGVSSSGGRIYPDLGNSV